MNKERKGSKLVRNIIGGATAGAITLGAVTVIARSGREIDLGFSLEDLVKHQNRCWVGRQAIEPGETFQLIEDGEESRVMECFESGEVRLSNSRVVDIVIER